MGKYISYFLFMLNTTYLPNHRGIKVHMTDTVFSLLYNTMPFVKWVPKFWRKLLPTLKIKAVSYS